MPGGSGPIAVLPAFLGKTLEYSSQSMAIEIAWRSLRLRAFCSVLSPSPMTGSSMLKAMK